MKSSARSQQVCPQHIIEAFEPIGDARLKTRQEGRGQNQARVPTTNLTYCASSTAKVITRLDLYIASALFFGAVLLNFLELGALEFFRHTEADRTLIAWEMQQSGQYLVPQLLSSTILTKPPLFYWALAALIEVFGPPTELLARIPSAFAASLLVVGQYFLVRLARIRRSLCLFAAVVAGTGVQFLKLASAAEIDMLYALFSTLALGACFLSFLKKKFSLVILSYFFLGAAFLTKGPPILAFLAVPAFVSLLRAKEQRLRLLIQHLAGLALFGLIVSAWLIPLANQVGWDALMVQFRGEIVDRIIDKTSHRHNWWFYVPALFSSHAPWSLFLFGALMLAVANFSLFCRRVQHLSVPLKELFIFSLLTVTTAVVSLSLAEGKSYRYLFPVVFAVANLVVISGVLIRDSWVEVILYRVGRFLGGVGGTAALIVGMLISFQGVDRVSLLTAGALLSAALFFLVHVCERRNRPLAILALVLCMASVRVGQWLVYNPHRNATRSVTDTALTIDLSIPHGEPVYTVEMYERWVSYYLKLQGRNTHRLTPELVRSLSASLPMTRPEDERPVYLLLSGKEEYWRYAQLLSVEPRTREEGRFGDDYTKIILVKTYPSALSVLKPRAVFPTTPTKPF